MKYDLCIVGCGLSGATIANLGAKDGYKVLIIDKRNHISGNIYDYIDEKTGIRINLYGVHLFHTNDKEVWEYINEFGEWKRWEHCVLADINNTLVPVPVNITTINKLFNENIINESEAIEWLNNKKIKVDIPKNSEEVAINKVGPELYNLLFKNYTYKQWNKYPSELDPSVLERIPVRTSFDNRYFNDKYQALPVNGYTDIVKNMLSHQNITIKLDTDWFDFVNLTTDTWDNLIFTGPIDRYFNNCGLDKLEYRSLEFEWSTINTSGFFQQNSQINYPLLDTPYTRCIEYKHLLNQKSDYTIICKEKSTDNGEPYYPVPTKINQELYNKYKKLAENQKDVHFVGRLANYKYFNMDQAIRNSMDYYNRVFKPKI